MPTEWLVGAERSWVTSVANDPSDNGIVDPVERQPRPQIQFRFDTTPEIAEEIEDLFIYVNGPARGFLCKPPLSRDHAVTGLALGTGTGSPVEYQLTVTRGLQWDIKYPDEDTIVVYFNGVAQASSVWALGADGEITITATLGVAVTIDFEYWTPFQFVEEDLSTRITHSDLEQVRGVIIREVFV